MVKIYFKKLSPNAKAPFRAHPTDAGIDVYVATKRTVNDFSSLGNLISVIEYGTKLAFSIPKGYAMEFRPRSSVWKVGMQLCNGCGLIDQTYHLEVMAYFYQFNPQKSYEIGERIGQLVLLPYVDPEEIEFVDVGDGELPMDNGDREGGFGSTGVR